MGVILFAIFRMIAVIHEAELFFARYEITGLPAFSQTFTKIFKHGGLIGEVLGVQAPDIPPGSRDGGQMDFHHERRIPIEGNAEAAMGDHVVPEMRDVLMGPVAEGLIVPELVADNDNNILGFEPAIGKIPIERKKQQHRQ
jgi:hypothetical protein